MRAHHRRLEAAAREAPAGQATQQAAVADQDGGHVKFGDWLWLVAAGAAGKPTGG